MNLTEKEIDELVVEAQNGGKNAVGELYDFFLEPIYRFLFFRVSTTAEAEDLTEEVFLKMIKNISKYKKREKMPFSAWLFRIAKNALIDFYRKKVEIDEIPENLADQKSAADEKTETKINHARLLTAMKKLPKSQSEAIILRFFSDRKNAEIAAILGKSETAVRILQSRGLKKLKEILGKK